MSTVFHPQTDGQSERVIEVLEDLLRACVLEFGGNWEEHMALVEFMYNNSHQTTIGMALYEALYGRRCRTPLYWEEIGDQKLYGAELVQVTTEKVRIIKDHIKAAHDSVAMSRSHKLITLASSITHKILQSKQGVDPTRKIQVRFLC